MNPNETIKPWLLACGKSLGIREAHEYLWKDASTRPQEPYFVYRTLGTKPDPGLPVERRTLTAEEWDVVIAGGRHWPIVVEIRLFRAENGMADLAACACAAGIDPDIISIFKRQGVEYKDCIKIDNVSTATATITNFEFVMFCVFHTWMGFTHTKFNHRVGSVNIDGAITLE